MSEGRRGLPTEIGDLRPPLKSEDVSAGLQENKHRTLKIWVMSEVLQNRGFHIHRNDSTVSRQLQKLAS